jgi:hypothetical protein
MHDGDVGSVDKGARNAHLIVGDVVAPVRSQCTDATTTS